MGELLYNHFVRKNVNVQYEYERYVREHIGEHSRKRMKHWIVLGKLLWHYKVKKSKAPLLYTTSSGTKKLTHSNGKNTAKKPIKGPYMSGAESEAYPRPKPYHFVLDLMKYDVISFDIFDTLLFRPFANPVDLFHLVGKRLNYPAIFTGYTKARREAEREARDELEKKLGIREVNIYEIYEQMERKIGISAEAGIRAEVETEKDYLFPNPYMQIVFQILRAQGKKIILTSDMYLPGEIMEKLLQTCGYEGYEKLYVSCDYRCNKSSGELFRRVLQDYPEKKIVHVGDNPTADIEGAKKVGIETRYYKNVNEIGKQYRAEWMSNLTGSAYSGLINAYLHNGLNQFPFFYEYGFVYGGIYVFGFCNWIQKKAKSEGIEKIIFLSRDGDIYQKVYNKFYGDIENEYIYWSRFANMKYMIEIQQDAFIERVIKQKAMGTLDVELSSILNTFSIPLSEEDLKMYGLYFNTIVRKETMPAIQKCFQEHWDKIVVAYDKEKQLVIKEVKTLLGDAKTVAIIDVGWTASGPIGFKTFVEKYVTQNCTMKCWMAGGAGSYGTSDYVLPFYMEECVDAYLFSPRHNRRNEQVHVSENVAVTNNAVFELFTQTQYPSFRGRTNEGGYEFDIPETENFEKIGQVHKGILDFCDLYWKTYQKDPYFYNISGFDAYRPFTLLAFHKSYFEKNFLDIINGYGLSGDQKHQCIETIGARMKHYYAHNGGKKQ